MRDLIRRDQDRAAKIASMQALVNEGLESGIASGSMDDILNEARKRAGVPPKPGHGL